MQRFGSTVIDSSVKIDPTEGCEMNQGWQGNEEDELQKEIGLIDYGELSTFQKDAQTEEQENRKQFHEYCLHDPTLHKGL